MLNNFQQMEPHDYDGRFFIGTVVDIQDPEKIERVKCTIPGLFNGEISDLPWIAPFGKLGAIPNKPGAHGTFGLIPQVGSNVYVTLQDGNPLYPVYWGSPVLVGAPVAEANANYGNRYGWKDPAGNLFQVDVNSGNSVITIRHSSGTLLRINNDGSIDLQATGTINSTAPQWNHDGPMHITGDVVHDGNLTHLGDTTQTGNTTHNGDLTLTGNIIQTGNITTLGAILGTDLGIPGLNFASHHHVADHGINVSQPIPGT